MRNLLLILAAFVVATPAVLAREITEIRVIGDVDYPPFMFTNPAGEQEGFLFDLWRLWQQKTGIKVTFIDAPWAKAQDMLLAGDADVIDAIFKTPERESLYDFSEPYADVPASIFTHESISGIHNYKSLLGFQIGVQAGDSCVEHLLAHGVTSLVQFETNREVIAAAIAGHLKLFCMDRSTGEYYTYRLGGHKSITRAFDLHEGGLRHAVKKGNTELLTVVERGMAKISKEEFLALRDKWMGQPISASPYLSPIYTALWVLSAAGLLLALWVWMLRLAVRKKTSELEQQKANLAESEERYRVMVEETVVPCLLSENGRLTAPNRAALNILGMTNPLQLIGLNIEDISPFRQPDGTPSADKARAMRKLAIQNHGHHFEWELLSVDGLPIHVMVVSTPITLRGTQYLYIAWFDVTAQKIEEGLLRKELAKVKK